MLHQLVAKSLARAGSSIMFGLPGGGPNLDLVGAAIAEGMRFILAHGETEAAIMASTYALLTDTPAAVVATRGPGASSLANGAAQATLDRYPLIAITDTVPSSQAARVAHQRIDQRALFDPLSKQSATVGPSTPEEQLFELINQSIRWPFGTVHLDYDPTAKHDASAALAELEPAITASSGYLRSDSDMEAAAELLRQARRPVVVVGAESGPLADLLLPLLEVFGCPVLTTYQAIGVVPAEGHLNAGLFTNGALEREVIRSSDLIITIGLDLVEPIPAPWEYEQPVIRISSAEQVDCYLPATVDLVGDVVELYERLEPVGVEWQVDAAVEFREKARQAIRSAEPVGDGGALGPIALVDAVAESTPANATVTVDAGAHFLAVMPLWPAHQAHQLLISNGLATMGFAIPAAIGAALARPGTPVVAFTGDGGLSMVMAELETIVRLSLPITVVVFNDAALSLIQVKQGEAHGGASAVKYRHVDFAGIAEASGMVAHVAESAKEVKDVLVKGWDEPRLIDARIDPHSYPAIIKTTRG